MKTYGNLTLSNCEKYWILDGMPPYVVIKLKDLFKNISFHKRQPIRIPNTPEVCCDIDWFLYRYPFELSNKCKNNLNLQKDSHKKFIEGNYRVLSGDYDSPVNVELKDGMELRPYQKQLVDLAWRVKRLLVADEVGLGKTPEAIGCLMKNGWLPALVVVQSHLPKQWEDQIKKFTDLKTHKIMTGKNYELPPVDVYIIKYTIMKKWVAKLLQIGLKTIIMDEIQEIRRIESAKHEACVVVSENVDNSLGLSGTPVVNYGNEIWNIYKAINPNLFPDFYTFSTEWLQQDKKVKNPKALGTFLRDQFSYIRRTKRDIGKKFKELNKIVHTVDYNKKDIDKMEAEAKVLAITALQGSFIERGQASRELSIKVRKATGVSKAKSVAEYVKVILQNGEKVLLMGYHRDVYDIWLRELSNYKISMYTGSESPKQKQQSFNDFTKGDSNLMIMSLRAGSAGLDGLQHVCSYIVFGELDWSGVLHEQAIGRLDRDGQKEQVTAIFLVSDSGSDPIVTDIIGIKKSQQDGISDPFNKNRVQYSNDSIIKKFAENLINKK